MRGVSLELVLLALFGVALLIQWAIRFLRSRALQVPTERVDRSVLAPPTPSIATSSPSSSSSSSSSSGVVDAAPALRPQARARAVKRYSRHALLGNRRTVQDVVVAAAVLGPCHAHRTVDRSGAPQ